MSSTELSCLCRDLSINFKLELTEKTPWQGRSLLDIQPHWWLWPSSVLPAAAADASGPRQHGPPVGICRSPLPEHRNMSIKAAKMCNEGFDADHLNIWCWSLEFKDARKKRRNHFVVQIEKGRQIPVRLDSLLKTHPGILFCLLGLVRMGLWAHSCSHILYERGRLTTNLRWGNPLVLSNKGRTKLTFKINPIY